MRIQSVNFSNERAVRFQHLNKIYDYPMHLHQFAELVILLGGELDIIVEDRREHMRAGDAAFIGSFQPHKYISSEMNDIAIFTFSPSFIPDFFKATDGKVGEGAVFKPEDVTLKLFNEKIFPKSDLELYDIKGALYLILGEFLSKIKLKEGSNDINLASKVVYYINKHLSEKISLSDIARELNYAPNYLSSCIQKVFSMNLCSLIASIRSDKAKYLLLETDKTGLEICFECGFGSERSFHRQFKQNTGRTPKEYRLKVNGKNINHGFFKRFD
ncbi:MAG: AraC family transcriptional regulator [Clostridia bacterium]|nr:AraC family transcriptional regulator [Clostridia bacterium]